MDEPNNPKKKRPKGPQSPKSRPHESTGAHSVHLLGLTKEEKTATRLRTARALAQRDRENGGTALERVPLTDQESAFVRAIFTVDETGKPRTRGAAYMIAYPTSCFGEAARVANRPHVKRAIEAMRREVLQELLSDEVLAQGIASQAARLVARNKRWYALQEVVAERKKFYTKMRKDANSLEAKVSSELGKLLRKLNGVTGEDSSITVFALSSKMRAIEKMLSKLASDGPLPEMTDLGDLKDSVETLKGIFTRVADIQADVYELRRLTPAPGAETGLVTHRDRATKYGTMREWNVDPAPLTEMRNLEDSVAAELGQVAPKRTDITSDGQRISSLVLMNLDSVSNDELDERIKRIQEMRAGYDQAIEGEIVEHD